VRVLITGAAGAGTSTVGHLLAKTQGAFFLEADGIYWSPSTPPFQQKRSTKERRELMLAALDKHAQLVVAGSIMQWGEQIENAFDWIVFLYAPVELRLARIKARDTRLFGVVNPQFLTWAEQYETGSLSGRSLAKHTQWLDQRTCPILRLAATSSPSTLAQAIIEHINTMRHRTTN